MTNEQLAQLRDPERRMPGWWDWHGQHYGGKRMQVALFTGPDWHADDLACFRDWRPVLLAAGWAVYDGALDCYALDEDGCIQAPPRPTTYRAAILAAVAWLAEHEPELLREAIARVEDGK